MRNLIIGAIFGIVCGAVVGATLIGPQLVEQIPGFQAESSTAGSYSNPDLSKIEAKPALTATDFESASAETSPVETEWRLASAYGMTVPELGNLAKRIEEIVWRASDGQFKIRVHNPGSLVAPEQMFDAVRSGTIDAAFASPADWADKVPALGLFSSVPFGPSPREYLSWFYFSGGEKAYQDIYRKQGIHSIICGMSAPEASGWFKHKINTVQDIQGLRMRISGLGAKVLEKLGAEPQNMSDGDVFVAFEAGLLDAAEFSQPSIDLQLGLHKMAQHYYFPGWHQPATLFELMVNLGTWEALAPARKMQLETACGDNVRFSLAQSEANQFAALKNLVDQGATIQSWPPDVLEALEQAWADVALEEAKKNRDFQQVWNSIEKFRLEFDIWRELSQP